MKRRHCLAVACIAQLAPVLSAGPPGSPLDLPVPTASSLRQTTVSGAAVTVTKAHIAEALVAPWRCVKDLSFTCAATHKEGASESAFVNSVDRVRFARGGRVVFVKSTWGTETDWLALDSSTTASTQSVLFDADAGESITLERRRAWVEEGLNPKVIEGLNGYFFNLNPHSTLHATGDATAYHPLERVIDSDWAELRPTLESCEGTPCVVVDIYKLADACLRLNPDGSIPRRSELPPGTRVYVRQRVWLDPARGYLPIRQEHLRPDGSISMSVTTTASIEASPGLWLAVDGVQFVAGEKVDMQNAHLFGLKPGDLSPSLTFRIHVPRRDDGSYELRVNSPVLKEAQSPRELLELPPGLTIERWQPHD